MIEAFHGKSENYLYTLRYDLLYHSVEYLKNWNRFCPGHLPVWRIQSTHQAIVQRKIQATRYQKGWNCKKHIFELYPSFTRWRRTPVTFWKVIHKYTQEGIYLKCFTYCSWRISRDIVVIASRCFKLLFTSYWETKFYKPLMADKCNLTGTTFFYLQSETVSYIYEKFIDTEVNYTVAYFMYVEGIFPILLWLRHVGKFNFLK